ncbi:MAG TPA: sensor histidine kinase [Chloroflexota bacterium]|nr:sensor histidine kinase [Chloroflexota bacterium]
MRRGPVARLKAFAHGTGLLPRLLVAEAVLLALLFAASLLLVGRLADSLVTSQSSEWLLLGKSTGVAIDGLIVDATGDLQDSAIWYREAAATGQVGQAQNVLDLTEQHSPIFTNGVVVVGPDHRIRVTDRQHASLLGTDLSRSWPTSSLPSIGTDGALAWGVVGDGRLGPTVALAVPLDPAGSQGYLVGLIGGGNSEVERILTSAVRLGQSGHAEIVDQNCRVLFTTEPGHFLGSGEHPTFCRAMTAQGKATIGKAATEVPEQGDLAGPHLMAFVPLQNQPWALEIGTSITDAYGPATQLRDGSVAVLAVVTFLVFLATTVVVHKVVEPVTTLSRIARQIAAGEPSGGLAIPWGGEIGELARSLETMRLRFAGWAATLEEQVTKRTEELAERNRELRQLYESLRQQEGQRQALLGRILTAQEDERQRISRELHDSIGQAFWALTLNLERLQGLDGCPPTLQGELASLQKLAAESLSDLRRLTVALRPAALDDLGLVPAIRRYAELYLGDAGIAFEIVDHGSEGRLDPFRETVVYRVIQEAINNVARHSGATRARVELRREENTLSATVTDNGRGFDRTTREPGVGLQGMAERALLVGAKLDVDSTPGDGTTVSLTVPLSTFSLRGQNDPEKSATC